MAVQAPAAPLGDLARNYYPFLDIARGNCTVKAALGPTHWSDYLQVRHGVLELVGTSQHSKTRIKALLVAEPMSNSRVCMGMKVYVNTLGGIRRPSASAKLRQAYQNVPDPV